MVVQNILKMKKTRVYSLYKQSVLSKNLSYEMLYVRTSVHIGFNIMHRMQSIANNTQYACIQVRIAATTYTGCMLSCIYVFGSTLRRFLFLYQMSMMLIVNNGKCFELSIIGT